MLSGESKSQIRNTVAEIKSAPVSAAVDAPPPPPPSNDAPPPPPAPAKVEKKEKKEKVYFYPLKNFTRGICHKFFSTGIFF